MGVIDLGNRFRLLQRCRVANRQGQEKAADASQRGDDKVPSFGRTKEAFVFDSWCGDANRRLQLYKRFPHVYCNLCFQSNEGS